MPAPASWKGIVLAGGAGSRLHPVTRSVSKQLLPIYDKPMIYYPLSVLMLAGIRDILLISTPEDVPLFERLLGDGADFGISLSYEVQAEPRGLAEAFLIGADHIGDGNVCMILGDNVFHGNGLSELLQREAAHLSHCPDVGATLYGYRVADPQRYGVVVTDADGTIEEIAEKPEKPSSDVAVTGLYMYDNDVVRYAREVVPSARGELEITDINNRYVAAGRARLVELGRGMAWLDTGTHDSLLEAATFVQVLEHRQGEQIACLEEVAYRQGWIDGGRLAELAAGYGRSTYGESLRRLAATV
jgi:glucose-1-phosphate thymidylyltransferase